MSNQILVMKTKTIKEAQSVYGWGGVLVGEESERRKLR
jgi:hypothetical protein